MDRPRAPSASAFDLKRGIKAHHHFGKPLSRVDRMCALASKKQISTGEWGGSLGPPNKLKISLAGDN
jgi:hypothetical protein